MASYDRLVRKLLREAGGEKKRSGKSSHEIWAVPAGDGNTVAVTVPQGIKSKITVNEILKQAGIDRKI